MSHTGDRELLDTTPYGARPSPGTEHSHPSGERFAAGAHDHRALRRLPFFVAVLAVGALLAYSLSGNTSHLVPWAFALLALVLPFRLLCRNMPLGRSLLLVVVASYLLLSIVGICCVWSYSNAYGLPFGPQGDDSYYFANVFSLASSQGAGATTLYERCLLPVYKAAELIREHVQLQDILPLNWAFGAATIGLATMLSITVSGRFTVLAPLALLLNFTFVDSVCHLYRDGTVMVLTLLCLLRAVRGHYLQAVLFAFLAGLTRGSNGMLCLFYVGMVFLARNGYVRSFGPRLALVMLAVAFAIAFADLHFALGSRARSLFSAAGPEMSLLERAALRAELRLSEGDGYDSSRELYSLGPAGLMLLPVANLFSPIRILSISGYVPIHAGGRVLGYGQVVRPTLLFVAVTALLWPVFGPCLVGGFLAAAGSRGIKPALLVMFFVTLLSVTFISFQARHRTAFAIFYPTFVALAEFRTPRERVLRRWLTWVFIAAICLVNMLPYLLSG